MKCKIMKHLLYTVLLFSAILFVSCEEQTIYEGNFDEQQISAKSLNGTWESPKDVKTPDNVPKSIISKLRIVFTVDENGMPNEFFSEGANDVFKTASGTWSFINNDVTMISLIGIEPIKEFEIDASVKDRLKLWFNSTWRDTEGNSGEGLFEVTLIRAGTE